MAIAIASHHNWYLELVDRIQKSSTNRVVSINNKEQLNFEYLANSDIKLIFFPHWSYIIPPEIHENFECIIFHMTDVPFGRGGSPLQNLISRGIYETQISAIRCVKALDAGDVYLKRPLSLYGSAEEIYIRANRIIEEMIITIIKERPHPVPQIGEVVSFKRRKPNESNIAALDSLDKVFDYIRMLDAETYPNAFLETEHFRIEFSRASLKVDHVLADVRITLKNTDEK